MLAAVLVCVMGLGMSCASRTAPDPRTTSLNTVIATIPPLYGLVRPLLPDTVRVEMLIGPGQSAHGHRLTPSEVASARTADVIFAVGLGMEEGALEQFERDKPDHQTIAVFADVVDRHLVAEHEHEEGHDHADIHLWLDPVLAERFVEAAAQVLIARAMQSTAGLELADQIAARRDEWLDRIRSVDADYRRALAPYQGQTVLTQHPAFGLLLERYGLHEFSLRKTSGEGGPSASELADALRTVKEHAVVAVFLEPQEPSALPRRIAERANLPVGTLDPLGGGDWEQFMRRNLEALVTTLSAGRQTP